jgi:hypothetical protein
LQTSQIFVIDVSLSLSGAKGFFGLLAAMEAKNDFDLLVVMGVSG